MTKRNRRPEVSRARRHFLGLAAAAGVRVAAAGSIIAAAFPSVGQAGGRAWWKSGHPGLGHGYGRGKHDPMCLLRGTAIMTPRGKVRVENLRIGDLVKTLSGKAMPIKWIGHHIYKRTGRHWSKAVVPIRIARFALDDRTPQKDLYLSARHAIFIDGMLVRAQDLVNGTTITPESPVDEDTLEYFHIMLDSHEVLLAEGAPVESCLLEGGNYEAFTNFAEFARLYPAEPCATMAPCAPYVGYGGREHLKALLHLATGRPDRIGSPLDVAWSRIAARGKELLRSGETTSVQR